MRKKVVLRLAGGVAVVTAALLSAWQYHRVVPAGLRLRSVEPYFTASRDLGAFPSPEGTREVRVVVNDAGAMHSGNHWVWVLAPTSLGGQRIVAEGYVPFEETRRETLPLRWLSDSTISLSFRQGRRSAAVVTRTVSVP
jgi:hypothetical protein